MQLYCCSTRREKGFWVKIYDPHLGAPSRKGCVVNYHLTKARATNEYAPRPFVYYYVLLELLLQPCIMHACGSYIWRRRERDELNDERMDDNYYSVIIVVPGTYSYFLCLYDMYDMRYERFLLGYQRDIHTARSMIRIPVPGRPVLGDITQ